MWQRSAISVGYAVTAAVIVGLAAASGYYGYAVFGESAQRSQSTTQWHSYNRYHK